jgi:NADPH-dependent 2,4-dienoyl-CoA reductase/sulfur reductase-like enzyme
MQKAAVGLGGAAIGGLGAKDAESASIKRHWDLAADVVVVGAGASGLAAITATEQGASVIVVDQNYDIGGHAHRTSSHPKSDSAAGKTDDSHPPAVPPLASITLLAAPASFVVPSP